MNIIVFIYFCLSSNSLALFDFELHASELQRKVFVATAFAERCECPKNTQPGVFYVNGDRDGVFYCVKLIECLNQP